ncbi:SGNH/GDSL hydrolase family protein [Metabacillus sp. RGM 3146]|uniref:SGNH/GDSL hydrolase family protein n=1 Tax=Metabacillus sp. RGM 3146 TaxID=3401092 RepID=UPI003B9B02C4
MKIICFGDSLTRGVSLVKGRLRIIKKNYPYYLEEFLSNKKSTITVINKGVFNDNSDFLLKRLEKDVIEENPDYVIILIGGNDCNFKWNEIVENPDLEHEAMVPIERYIENVKTMIGSMRESGITPVVTTLPTLDPVRYYKFLSNQYSSSISHWICLAGGIEHWHGLYNDSLTKLADELNVEKIDVRTALKQAGSLQDLVSDDGIHLTSAGYRVLGKEISNFFKK